MPKKYRNPYRKGTPQNPYKTQTTKKSVNYAAKIETVQENVRKVTAAGYTLSPKQIKDLNDALFTKEGTERKVFTKEQKKVIDRFTSESKARRATSKKIMIDKFYGQNDGIEVANAGGFTITQRYNETEYEAKMRHVVEVINRKKDIINKGGMTPTGVTLSALMDVLQITNPGVLDIKRTDDIMTYDLKNYKNLNFDNPVVKSAIDKLVGLTSLSQQGQKAQRYKQARKYAETAGLSDVSADFLDKFLGSSLYMARNFAAERYKTDSMQQMHDEMRMITETDNKAARNKVMSILKSYDNAVKRATDKEAVTVRYQARLEKAIEEIRKEV